jgi:cellulose synthase/poly-beta-1,6-N-acetylglucosamine synthase-like glycosyltransferase
VLNTLLFWIFVASVAIQCGYAIYFFTRVFNLPKPKLPEGPATRPVSMIICAKNEALNLERNLPPILEQRYVNEDGKLMYEVIVVNDASDDNTEDVLYGMEQRYSHLWHVTISKETARNFPGKKFALGRGVEHATHDILLLTDADCVPAGEEWISRMILPMQGKTEIVAGYGGFRTGTGLLNAFIRWETMHTFLQFSTYAMAGKPYMAVGRNLACTRALFIKAQGSGAWAELPSGDDDLLMVAAATGDNTVIAGHRESFTRSEPKHTWKEWFGQKQRHISTGKYYRKGVKLLLGFYGCSHYISWVLFFWLLFQNDWAVIMMIFAMRCGMYWTIWQTTAFKLQDRKLFLWIPLCDVGWAIYHLTLIPYIIWKNKTKWK